jgi:hypothetical protein
MKTYKLKRHSKKHIMIMFLKEFPNGQIEEFLEYYKHFINDEFEKYKDQQLKMLNKDLI